jgi:hypothetical protein
MWVVASGLVVAMVSVTVAILVAASAPPPAPASVPAPRRWRRGTLELAIGFAVLMLATQAWATWISTRAYLLEPLPASDAVREVAPILLCAFVAYLSYLGIEHRFAQRRR